MLLLLDVFKNFRKMSLEIYKLEREYLLKLKKEDKNLKKQVTQDELDKACFQHDMVQGIFKDFPRGTASDKVLRDKTFNIAKNPKCDGYQRGLT